MNKQEAITQVAEAKRRLVQSNLKMCPLCDALNAIENGECFACSWHGQFVHDVVRIERGLRRLLRRCPEFRGYSGVIPASEYSKRLPRWRFLLHRVMKGPLDYRV